MRRGGFGKERSDQTGKDPVTISTVKVLHPITRVIVNVAWVAGGIASVFLWDWRYISAGMMVVLGGCIIGPWRAPMPYYISLDPDRDPLLDLKNRLGDEPRSP
jgi:hypothetical protein